ncbi:hypothetical protein N9H23_01210 [Flavobacteriaceae bacterium]|nr:hypothetical protein [Flavobacteriaceae bacterium]
MIKYLKENFSFIVRTFKKDKSLNQRQKNRANITFFFSFLLLVQIGYFTPIFSTPCGCLRSLETGGDREMERQFPGIASYNNPFQAVACNVKHGRKDLWDKCLRSENVEFFNKIDN